MAAKPVAFLICLIASVVIFAQESALYQSDSIYKINHVKARLWYSGEDKNLIKTTFYNRQGKLTKLELAPTENGTQTSTYYAYNSTGQLIGMVDTVLYENKTQAAGIARYDFLFDSGTLSRLTKYNTDGKVDYIIKFLNQRKTETLYRYKNETLIEIYSTEYISKLEERFYGWEKAGRRKSAWDYRFKYDYANGQVQRYLHYNRKRKVETAWLFYNPTGLLIKIEQHTPQFFEYLYY